MNTPNSTKEIQEMIIFHKSLSEKDKRRHAAIEANKLGKGGRKFISSILGISVNTIKVGEKDLLDEKKMSMGRIRGTGGGAKSKLDEMVGIDEAFLGILKNFTAGDPMTEKVKWTNLPHKRISNEMKLLGFDISQNIVKKLLKKHEFVKRKMVKSLATGQHKDRNAQFLNIAAIKEQFIADGNPVISMDSKKKKC